jgi:hypothetical protein
MSLSYPGTPNTPSTVRVRIKRDLARQNERSLTGASNYAPLTPPCLKVLSLLTFIESIMLLHITTQQFSFMLVHSIWSKKNNFLLSEGCNQSRSKLKLS